VACWRRERALRRARPPQADPPVAVVRSGRVVDSIPLMNKKGLRKLQLAGRAVTLWPRPRVMPGNRLARMTWEVRVDAKRTVTLHAPSGHSFDATDVIHGYQRHGDVLILDAQVIIRGNAVELLPKPWGATTRSFHRRRRGRLSGLLLAPQPTVAARLQILYGEGDHDLPPR